MLKNFFEIFNLPCQFKIDKKLLEQQYYQLQNQYHPDLQNKNNNLDIADINYGYQVLSQDLERAIYLLKIIGIDILAEDCQIKIDHDELNRFFLLQEEIEDNCKNQSILNVYLKQIEENINLQIAKAMDLYLVDNILSAKELIKAQYFKKNKDKIKYLLKQNY